MNALPFYVVDVFAEEKYAGNQLAVVREAKGLSDDDMQKIAREMNYSETTFILSEDQRDGGYDVRIFTPATEVPFAGHPTLGTAFVIRQEMIGEPVETVRLNLGVGQIPVTFAREKGRDVLWMRQNAPDFGPTIDVGVMADVLGLDAVDIDAGFPVQEVSTGMWFIIVPLRSLDAVRRSRSVRDKYFALVEGRQAKAILVFCREARSAENDLSVRVFVSYYGVEEDPATGSGNGCLAAYLVQHRYLGGSRIDVRVEQGHEIHRPSRLYLKAEERDGTIHVRVGGKVVMVAKGNLV
jgi:trans-2,3-dihydro-3-hydroxyanthranilate isomerase